MLACWEERFLHTFARYDADELDGSRARQTSGIYGIAPCHPWHRGISPSRHLAIRGDALTSNVLFGIVKFSLAPKLVILA